MAASRAVSREGSRQVEERYHTLAIAGVELTSGLLEFGLTAHELSGSRPLKEEFARLARTTQRPVEAYVEVVAFAYAQAREPQAFPQLLALPGLVRAGDVPPLAS